MTGNGTVALTGSDTTIINNRIFDNLADGDCVMLTFPNDMMKMKTGKNGNTIYALDETGNQCELVIRVVRGSADDKFLNNLLSQQKSNFAGFTLMAGEFIKNVGDGKGNISADTSLLGGGMFQKQVESKSNVEGETDQSVSVFRMKFSTGTRTIT